MWGMNWRARLWEIFDSIAMALFALAMFSGGICVAAGGILALHYRDPHAALLALAAGLTSFVCGTRVAIEMLKRRHGHD